jgi:hypothetical protein
MIRVESRNAHVAKGVLLTCRASADERVVRGWLTEFVGCILDVESECIDFPRPNTAERPCILLPSLVFSNHLRARLRRCLLTRFFVSTFDALHTARNLPTGGHGFTFGAVVLS